jgi:hypothetical protein
MDEDFSSGQKHVGAYAGYSIYLYRDQFLGFAHSLGSIAIQEMDATSLESFRTEGLCFIAATYQALKEEITSHLLIQALTRIQSLEKRGCTGTLQSELQSLRETSSQLAMSLTEVIAALSVPSRARRLIHALLGCTNK